MKHTATLILIFLALFTFAACGKTPDSSTATASGSSSAGEDSIPYIEDETIDWENITEVTLYADGYFGRTLEEPLVIDDPETVESLVEAVLDTASYTKAEDLYEGQNTIWADFGNGVVAGMYDDKNYGDLNDEIDYYHGPYYHFPPEFYDLVIKLLEDNR